MRNNIVDILSEYDDLTHVVILTYNIDFIFLQTVVIPSLRHCGHPSLTIFVDAQQAFNSYSNQMYWIDGIGMRYRVIPVNLSMYNSFHPKAILLSGEENGRLLIGSGNLTHGGWIENAEIWNVYDANKDGMSPFNEIRNYLDKIIKIIPNSGIIKNEISDAFNPDIHEWVKDKDGKDRILLGRFNDNKSLSDMIYNIIGEHSFDKLIICSPYYDDNGSMATNLKRRFNVKTVEVLFDSHSHTLTKKAANNLKKNGIKTQPIKFERAEKHGTFVHAKFYGFIEKSNVFVFSGSANCSLAALNSDKPGIGNAELMVFTKMSKKEFTEQFIDEIIEFDDCPIMYYEKTDKDDSDEPEDTLIKIITARFDTQGLTVLFNADRELKYYKCFVDDIHVAHTIINNESLLIKGVRNPRRMYITGIYERKEVRSNIIWINNEFELMASHRSRSLASVIATGVNPASWSINVWIELLDKFKDNLKYTPSWKKNRIDRRDGRDEAEIIYSRDDIFYNYQALPPKLHLPHPKRSNNRIMSLQQVLLQWFGYNWKDNIDKDNGSPGDDDDSNERAIISKAKRELLKTKNEKHDLEAGASTKNSIRKKLYAIADVFEDEDFILCRPPDYLKIDIAFASIILRTGYQEQWINQKDFIQITHKIWNSLFFSGCDDITLNYSSGWLEYLYVNSPDPSEFMNKLCDVELSASLILWVMALPKYIKTPEDALFHLSATAAIAKFPMLWSINKSEELTSAIIKQLQATKQYDAAKFNDLWIKIADRWNKLLMKGAALAELQKIIAIYDLGDLSKLVNTDVVHNGELLWQSSKLGFCITLDNCRRLQGENVDVISLHNPDEIKKISAPYLIPIRGLLESVKQASPVSSVSEKSRKIILEFIGELSGKLVEIED